MNIRAGLVQTIVFVAVMAGWFVFAATFIFRKQPKAEPTSKRERTSIIGLVLQGLSYAIVWSAWRRPPSPFIEGSGIVLEIVLALLALVIEFCSIWLILSAVRTLGKQWSLTARVTEGHRLVVEGPYNIVRNPIYTGMLGMLFATGVALSHWPNLLVGIAVFLIGTTIRVRSEEKLLREAFGPEFETYSSRVRAIIPGLY